ncbi:carbohydrate ABC transporter permease [Citricoccus parietis]|uniref:Carbohydrate ABC transporter permease n=1 Tax=Citricoccus parietis TaxID=592307 RepID=A0ABV6F0L7_9MICC
MARSTLFASKPSVTPGTLFGYASMVVIAAIVLVPIAFILLTSLKERPDIYTEPVQWIPDPFTAENYATVIDDVPFIRYFLNSLLITTVLTVVQVVLGIITAFALVFLHYPGRRIVFLFVVASLMVPNQVTVISNYALVAELNWRNTFAGIIIPLAGVAFGTFLMRNHFASLPREIVESAHLDGTGPFRLLFRILLPMSWPTVVAFTLITIVTEWNQYLWPFLMADTASVAPLPVGLTLLQNNEGSTNWGPVMAGTILTMIPILIVFLILQKQMIKGLTAGAVKG